MLGRLLLGCLLLGNLTPGCGGSEGGSGPKRPVAPLGEPSDEIDPDVIGAVVRNNSAHFRVCYEQGREHNPELAGRLEVRFAINPDGTVVQAQAVESSLPSKVSRCVVNVFYSLRLPQQDGQVIAQYPMFFDPG